MLEKEEGTPRLSEQAPFFAICKRSSPPAFSKGAWSMGRGLGSVSLIIRPSLETDCFEYGDVRTPHHRAASQSGIDWREYRGRVKLVR